MPKQEEIREHLIELLKQTDLSKETPEQIADAILWVENEDDVVIKADRELPPDIADFCVACRMGMFNSGYRAVEPLIKENPSG